MDSIQNINGSGLLEDSIPIDFKVRWLNNTLKFVKDDKISLFKYPEMPANRIKFLKVMITTSNRNGLFSPLWEALKIMSLKYDFRMYVERTGTEQGHLFLEKIHKSEDNKSEKKPEAVPSKSAQRKRERRKRNKKEFIETVRDQVDSISPAFIKNTLNTVFDFVTDDATATLAFDSLSRVEAQFIYNINGILKRKDALKELFSPICNILWTRINDTLNAATNYGLQMSSINVDPGTAKRQMKLFKTPKYVNKKPVELNESVDSDLEIENEPPNLMEMDKNLNGLKLLNSIENCAKTASQKPQGKQSDQSTIKIKKSSKCNMLLQSNSTTIYNRILAKCDKEVVNNTTKSINKQKLNNTGPVLFDTNTEPANNTKVVKPIKKTKLKNKETNNTNTATANTEPSNDILEVAKTKTKLSNVEPVVNTNTSNTKVAKSITKANLKNTRPASNITNNPEVAKPITEPYLVNPGPVFSINTSTSNIEPVNNTEAAKTIVKANLNNTKSVITNTSNTKPVNNNTDAAKPVTKTKLNNTKSVIVNTNNTKLEIVENGPSINTKSVTNTRPLKRKDLDVGNLVLAINNIQAELNELTLNQIKIPTVKKTVAGRRRDVEIQLPTMSTACAFGEMMGTRLPKPKVKLMEGLSTPLESEIGLRMMRSMGWEGGALGTREGGITEPIMPVLHLASKAGLGHFGNKKVAKANTEEEYHIFILENIYNLLNSCSTEMKIDFCDNLTKKERRFLSVAKKAFNSGKSLGLCLEREEDLEKRITSYLASKPGVVIDLQLINKKQIKLEKAIIKECTTPKVSVTSNSLGNKIESIKSKREKKISNFIRNCDSLKDEEILSLLNVKEQVKMTNKTLGKLRTRLFIMKSVLEFVESDTECVTLHCDMSSRMRHYLGDLCAAFNGREGREFPSSIETYVWLEIVRCLGDLTVTVHMGSSSFCLKKVIKGNLNVARVTTQCESFTSLQSSEGERCIDNDISKDIFYFGNINDSTTSNSTMDAPNATINVRIIQNVDGPMTKEIVKQIQIRISNGIASAPYPMLKCHGVKSDSLIYSCYDRSSFEYIKEVLHDFQIVEHDSSSLYKMAGTFKSDVSLSRLLHWLKLYHSLDVFKWDILSSSTDCYLIFTVSMDLHSFRYICDNHFKLNAGVDEVSFEIIL